MEDIWSTLLIIVCCPGSASILNCVKNKLSVMHCHFDFSCDSGVFFTRVRRRAIISSVNLFVMRKVFIKDPKYVNLPLLVYKLHGDMRFLVQGNLFFKADSSKCVHVCIGKTVHQRLKLIVMQNCWQPNFKNLGYVTIVLSRSYCFKKTLGDYAILMSSAKLKEGHKSHSRTPYKSDN